MDRRTALTAAAAAAAAPLLANRAIAQDGCAIMTRDLQAKVTPDEALQRLKEGNQRFVSGRTVNCDLMKQVKETADGQAPFASIVGCIDSRVPPELVFDQRLGDIFAARIAGNFVNDDILGSLEFTTKLAGSKLIVVLGHSECGAVKGAVDNAKMGFLTGTLSNIRPAVQKVSTVDTASSKDKGLVQKVAEQNVKDMVARLHTRSEVLAELIKAGKLKVVGAMHDIATGKISWIA